MFKIALILIVVGIILLYPGRYAFVKEIADVNPSAEHIHKKTIAIVCFILGLGLIIMGFISILWAKLLC